MPRRSVFGDAFFRMNCHASFKISTRAFFLRGILKFRTRLRRVLARRLSAGSRMVAPVCSIRQRAMRDVLLENGYLAIVSDLVKRFLVSKTLCNLNI